MEQQIQQDARGSARIARVSQQCLYENCPKMIDREQWPLNNCPKLNFMELLCLESDTQSYFETVLRYWLVYGMCVCVWCQCGEFGYIRWAASWWPADAVPQVRTSTDVQWRPCQGGLYTADNHVAMWVRSGQIWWAQVNRGEWVQVSISEHYQITRCASGCVVVWL